MPYITIPPQQTKEWQGIHNNPYLGHISESFNIDLEVNPGKVSLSDKMRVIVDSDTDLGGMWIPVKFLRTNADNTDRWWALTATGMFKTSGTSLYTGWATDTGTANSPTVPQDMIVHEIKNGEQRMIVSEPTTLRILNDTTANAWTASWWVTTLGQRALDSDFYHPLGKLQRLVAVGDADSNGALSAVHTIDRNDVVALDRILFPPETTLRLILSSENKFWFGCQNNFSGKGKIYEWDGSAPSATEYTFPDTCPMTGWIYNRIPYFISEQGIFYKYSGGSFVEVARFPGMVEEGFVFATTLPVQSINTIAPYGAVVDGSLVRIMVGAPQEARRMRGGVWIFDLVKERLYHNMAVGQHKVSGTEIDFGSSVVFRPGAIGLNPVAREMVVGANVLKTASSGKNVIARIVTNVSTDAAGFNRGHFTTSWITASEIQNNWKSLWLKFRRFFAANTIIVKHRVYDPLRDADGADRSAPQNNITWRNDTSFFAPLATGVVVGNEVEIVGGDNAGCLFHITSITDTNSAVATPNGSTSMIVSLDEAAPKSSTATAIARFDNFVKDDIITDTNVSFYESGLTGSDSDNLLLNANDKIQFKIDMRGKGVEIDELRPTFTNNQNTE